MSFDRLTPAKSGVLYSCLRKRHDGYEVVSVPPSLTIVNDGEDYRVTQGWDEALDGCPDMPAARRDYLKREIRNLTDDPHAYVETTGNFHFRGSAGSDTESRRMPVLGQAPGGASPPSPTAEISTGSSGWTLRYPSHGEA